MISGEPENWRQRETIPAKKQGGPLNLYDQRSHRRTGGPMSRNSLTSRRATSRRYYPTYDAHGSRPRAPLEVWA